MDSNKQAYVAETGAWSNYDAKKDATIVYVDEPSSADFGLAVPAMVADVILDRNRFMVKVFDWMGIGLAVTAVTAYAVAHSAVLPYMLHHTGLFFLLLLLELVAVHWLAAAAPNMAPGTAIALFLSYAVMNGATLAPLLRIYTDGSVAAAFVSATCVFVSMSAYGYATKRDLTSVGSLSIMALWGVILAMIVNTLMQSAVFDYLVSCVTIILFVGITAWDAQRIRKMGEALGNKGGESSLTGVAIVGALALYLDFLNIFIHLLKIFGKLREGKLEVSDFGVSQ